MNANLLLPITLIVIALSLIFSVFAKEIGFCGEHLRGLILCGTKLLWRWFARDVLYWWSKTYANSNVDGSRMLFAKNNEYNKDSAWNSIFIV